MAQIVESDQQGQVQSWAGVISVVEADNTPMTSMLQKRKKPSQVTHNWQVKKYPVVGHSGVIDGKDADNFSSNARVELQGVSQKSWYNPSASDFADEADIDGASNEMAEQIMDAAVTVKRIIEKRAGSNSDCQLQSGAGASITANETRGFLSWASASAQTQYPVPAAYRPPSAQTYSGTLADFDENDYLPISRSSYKQRRGPSKVCLFLGIDLKAKFTDFSQYTMDASGKTATRSLNANENASTYIRTIDKLVLDTGEVDLFATTFLKCDEASGEEAAGTHLSGVGIDPDKSWMAFCRQPRYVALENKGGGKRGIFDTIFLLGQDNPLSSQLLDIDS